MFCFTSVVYYIWAMKIKKNKETNTKFFFTLVCEDDMK